MNNVIGSTSTFLPVDLWCTTRIDFRTDYDFMFLLYVNDLPDVVTSSSVAAFAHDTKLFKHIISNITDNSLLQRDVNNVEAWSSSSDMSFNNRKCKVQSQTISRKRKPIVTSYFISKTLLEHCNHERDLGVWISCDLSWKKQVHSHTTKANKILVFVQRTTKFVKGITTNSRTLTRC